MAVLLFCTQHTPFLLCQNVPGTLPPLVFISWLQTQATADGRMWGFQSPSSAASLPAALSPEQLRALDGGAASVITGKKVCKTAENRISGSWSLYKAQGWTDVCFSPSQQSSEAASFGNRCFSAQFSGWAGRPRARRAGWLTPRLEGHEHRGWLER